MKIAKLNIEGYIGDGDLMSMLGGSNSFNLSKLKSFLDGIDQDTTDIHVFINSGGGSVTEGWAIYDKLKASGKKITTIGEGIVGSIATVIFMAGSERKLHENSNFFIHNPYWTPSGPDAMEAADLKNLGEDLQKEQQKIIDFYAKQTGTPVDTIAPLMDKATSLTTEEAIDMGFATSVIGENISANKYKLVAYAGHLSNTNKMEKKIEKNLGDTFAAAFNKLEGKIKKWLFKNMEIQVKDKEGKDYNLFIESDSEDITGKPAYTVAQDGTQSPAPDGDYIDANGKTITVKGGNVESVKDPVAANTEPTIEDLKAQIESSKTENDKLKSDLEAAKVENAKFKTDFEAVKSEVDGFKNVLIGAGVKFDNGEQVIKQTQKPTETKASSYATELAERMKNK